MKFSKKFNEYYLIYTINIYHLCELKSHNDFHQNNFGILFGFILSMCLT